MLFGCDLAGVVGNLFPGHAASILDERHSNRIGRDLDPNSFEASA